MPNESVDPSVEPAAAPADSIATAAPPRGDVGRLGFRALVVAQASAAFNDSALRMTVVLLAFRLFADSAIGVQMAVYSTTVMLAAYALFALAAGAAADRWAKNRLIVFWKWLEIPMIAAGLWGLHDVVHRSSGMVDAQLFNGSMMLVWAALAFLGVQSAFLAPARYGLLPELLDDEHLAQGNGILETGSYFGALAGTIAAGWVVSGLMAPAVEGWTLYILPIVAAVGAVASLFISYAKPCGATPGATPANLLDYTPLGAVGVWKSVRDVHGLGVAMGASAVFWGLSLWFLLNTPDFAGSYLRYKMVDESNNLLLVALSLGVGLGAYAAGRASQGQIELGMTPAGLAVWGGASLALAAVGYTAGDATGSFWLAAGLTAAAGFGAGVYLVPINAFIQRAAPVGQRGRVVALANLVAVGAMLLACLADEVVGATLDLSPSTDFLIIGLGAGAAFVASIFVVRKYWPRFLCRVLVWVFYRVRVVGLENIPREGGALLVLNHVSFVDGVIVLTSVPRYVHFMVYQKHFDMPQLNWFGKGMEAVPVDATASPRDLLRSLRKAGEILEQGEVMCIFAEGGLTRTGSMMQFQRGYEQVMRRNPGIPIIPGYIDGVWGSIFSFSGGKFFLKWPRRLPYPVTLKFGAPLPADTSPEKLRQTVALLGTDCFELRRNQRPTLHRQFLRTAKRRPRQPYVADSLTPMVNYGQALLKVVVLRQLLKRKLGDDKFVGVLLPPSVGGALSNWAIALQGKVPVHLNYTIGVDVVNACLAQCGIKRVVTSKMFIARTKIKPDAEIIYLEDLKGDVQTSDKILAAAVRYLPAAVGEWLLGVRGDSNDDLATIVFSSGTTGLPKG
ncbi:MAG: MFS transporter, partial [Planctomycetia bacterium]